MKQRPVTELVHPMSSLVHGALRSVLVLALLWAGLGASSASAQATRRCNAAPAGSQSSWGGSGLTSLAREQPRSVERAPGPRLWLTPGFSLLRMPHNWVEGSLGVTALPATWLWLEGRFAYGLPAQGDVSARAGMWADGRAGVRLWRKEGEVPWRFVLQACRGSNYMPSSWEGGARPEGGDVGGVPEPTRLDWVSVEVPAEHGLWLDGGLRYGSLAYCVGGCGGGPPTDEAGVRTWAAGLRYARFISARLDGRMLRAGFEAWAYVLFRPRGLPTGPVEVVGPLLPDAASGKHRGSGFEGGVRYTPWAFEWAQVELAVGYTPAARDLYLHLGINFPVWLL